jgi:lysophospholipase L1-like esterase
VIQYRTALLTVLATLAMILTAVAQDRPLLDDAQADHAITRSIQLVESTMMTIPGLARAAAPVLENAKQAQLNLKADGYRNSGQTYTLLANLRAYVALADSLPKPYPYPEEASNQLSQIRAVIFRLDTHFRALLDDLQTRLRNPDRDNLSRYADANLREGPPQPSRPRVVFLGDSITDGWRLNEYFPDANFVNRGISGQVTGEMLGRMKADVIDLQPKAVVILAGTNDIARGVDVTTIQNNLAMIAELAKARRIKVIMASILPVHDYKKAQNPRYDRTPGRPPQTILALNDWIRAYCKSEHHTYLDYFSAMVDANGFLQEDLADDGLHPNAAGYRVMSPLVWQAITSNLPQGAGPRR